MSELDIRDILKHIPHRYPFLLVDKVMEWVPGKSLVAMKNVTYNEPFFMGHFPQYPIMPGVLIIEALAQAAGILIFKTNETLPSKDNWFYLAGIDDARFKRVVQPGDQLILKIELERALRDVWKFKCSATVQDHLACSATIINAKGAV